MIIFPDPITDKDFPEDFKQENGCYQNKCCLCGEIFKGNKHRVTCKLCTYATKSETKKTIKTQLNQQAERLMKLSFHNTDFKDELVSVAVELQIIGDKIEDENKALGAALQKISDTLKEIKP